MGNNTSQRKELCDCTKCATRYERGLLSAAEHGDHKHVEILMETESFVNKNYVYIANRAL